MHLKKELSATKVWAIVVGMVISGQYFGWNFGIAEGGVLGLVIAVVVAIIFYSIFIFCLTDLSSAMPSSGGPSIFAERACGRFVSYIVAFALFMEYLFATPAIAVSLGQYLHFIIPGISASILSLLMLIIVFCINCFRITHIARIEMIVTLLAIMGLVIFYIFSGVHIISVGHVHNIGVHKFNIFAAIPFALWFFLAIEGGAIVAGEAKDSKNVIPRGFISALLTLSLFSVLSISAVVMTNAAGVGFTDSPLPMTLRSIGYPNIAEIVAIFGVFGLFASLNGIVMGYSRLSYALAEQGFLPKIFSQLSRQSVPVYGLIIPGVVVVILALSSSFSEMLVTLATFSAIIMYIITLVSYCVLKCRDTVARVSFRVPMFVAVIGLLLALLFLPSVLVYVIIPHTIEVLGFSMHAWVMVLCVWLLILICYKVTGEKEIKRYRE